MKGDVYYLKDNVGLIGYKFVVDDDDFCLRGTCYEACSWYADEKIPLEYQYVAGVYCKWDACTHWYFRGEDYEPGINDDADSYYHLCGGYSFMGHITAMCFIWKLAEQIISESEHARSYDYLPGYIHDEYYDHERIKQMIDLSLKGYEIVKESNLD